MSTNIWSNDYNPFQHFKVLAWYNRLKAIKTGNFMAPVNIALDVVQGTGSNKMCGGIKCDFCMSDLEDKSEQAHVPFDILMRIPAFWAAWGVKSVCLAGHHSDPLAYNHTKFALFLRELAKYNIEIGIATNGVLLNAGLIPDMARTCNWTGFSVNAGTADTFKKHTGSDKFDQIVENMTKLAAYAKENHLKHSVGFKFLITDDNYTEIYDAVMVAKKAGCRHVQIRPCELPEERANKIDVDMVETQLKMVLAEEVAGKFEVFGIREKFTHDFKKQPPKRCIASPLGSTWKADGDVVICPDRRWSAHEEGMTLGNFIKDGIESILEKWGGPEHREMIRTANCKIGQCIRCTSLKWHSAYENVIEEDNMDVTLI